MVQASASLKPLCVDTALDTGPLDTVGKTSGSVETTLETSRWKPALSLVTKLVTSVLVTPGFSASSLCAPAPSSRVRAPAKSETEVGKLFPPQFSGASAWTKAECLLVTLMIPALGRVRGG
jgi:hypothetical protein